MAVKQALRYRLAASVSLMAARVCRPLAFLLLRAAKVLSLFLRMRRVVSLFQGKKVQPFYSGFLGEVVHVCLDVLQEKERKDVRVIFSKTENFSNSWFTE